MLEPHMFTLYSYVAIILLLNVYYAVINLSCYHAAVMLLLCCHYANIMLILKVYYAAIMLLSLFARYDKSIMLYVYDYLVSPPLTLYTDP